MKGSCRSALSAWAVTLSFAATGCGSSSKSPSDGSAAPSDGADARTTGGSDAGGDRSPGPDAPPATCAHEISNPACWSGIDVSGFTSLTSSFIGAAYDGRYVYLVNGATGAENPQLRYDTHGSFSSSSSFSVYDPSGLAYAKGFMGGVFDGRYVYYVPHVAAEDGAGGGTFDDVATRFDTTATAFNGSGFATFNLTKASGTADLNVPGYRGGAFDGRYVYFAPSATGTAASGRVARYDTQGSFTTAGSWTSFDTTTVDTAASGFYGALFDGRYLYLVPDSPTRSIATRYDTHADFATASSWATFDTATLNPDAAGFIGGVFDGRYIYFVPNMAWQGIFTSLVTRYDTRAPFDTASSWTTFDTGQIAGAGNFNNLRFLLGAFDGRYVYLLPDSSFSPLVRFDTQQDFATPASWTAIDLDRVMPGVGAGNVSGAAFDGRYLYLVPANYEPLLRFDARDATPLPAGSSGSFF